MRTLEEISIWLGCLSRQRTLAGYPKPTSSTRVGGRFLCWAGSQTFAPLTMAYDQFLARCKDLFAVFEGLKSAPLRALLLKLGVPKDEIKSVEGVKLLAYLCQLATIAKNEGWGLIGDAGLIIQKWEKDTRLGFCDPLFALNGLRIAHAHALSRAIPKRRLRG